MTKMRMGVFFFLVIHLAVVAAEAEKIHTLDDCRTNPVSVVREFVVSKQMTNQDKVERVMAYWTHPGLGAPMLQFVKQVVVWYRENLIDHGVRLEYTHMGEEYAVPKSLLSVVKKEETVAESAVLTLEAMFRDDPCARPPRAEAEEEEEIPLRHVPRPRVLPTRKYYSPTS